MSDSEPTASSPESDVAAPPMPDTAHESAGNSGEREVEATPVGKRPTFVFFGVVSAISLLADVGSKAWAEVTLMKKPGHTVGLIEDNLTLTLAYNPGGAWGLLQNASENLRKPFFLLVSVMAIAFIVSLYSRLHPTQRALKWGLPLVLGGALGNLADRITRDNVIDFIDYRADWVRSLNEWVQGTISSTWTVTDHWPTFNVADISICIGVALMAVDMITSRRSAQQPVKKPSSPELSPAPAGAPSPESGEQR